MKTTLMVMGKWINTCHKELISVSHNVTMSHNVTGNEHHRKETSCSPDGHPLSEGISTNTTGKQRKIFHRKATSANPKCGVLPAPASYHPRQAEPISKRPTWVIGSQVRPDPQKIVTSWIKDPSLPSRRSGIDGMNWILHFYALQSLPLGDVIVMAATRVGNISRYRPRVDILLLTWSSPTIIYRQIPFTNLFSCILLKEPCGVFEVANIILVGIRCC